MWRSGESDSDDDWAEDEVIAATAKRRRLCAAAAAASGMNLLGDQRGCPSGSNRKIAEHEKFSWETHCLLPPQELL